MGKRTVRAKSGRGPAGLWRQRTLAPEGNSGNPATETAGRTVDRFIPWLFLVVAVVLGTLYVFIMPPMQVPDEMMHFARAYSVSRGVCVASPDIDMPKSFDRLNQLFPRWLEKERRISVADLREALRLPLNDTEMAGNGRQRSLDGFINQNSYHCAAYVPEAISLRLGRLAAFPPLALMYLCRMTNLAVYVGLVFLALWLLPDFRVTLFCVALLPMALHQAASVSADSTLLAVSLLFTAYVLRLAFDKEACPLGIRQHAILGILILFLVLTKALVCAVFLLLIIPAARFTSKRARWLILAAYLVLAISSAAAWRYVNSANSARQTEQRALQGIDAPANVRFMYQHPVDVALVFARSINDPEYLYMNLRGFIGTMGWLTIDLPDWLVWIYTALLLAAAASQTRSNPLTRPARLLLLLFAAAFIANTLPIGWVGNISRGLLDHLELLPVVRVPLQGRYWLPFAFGVLILFSTRRTWISPRQFIVAAAAIAVLASAVALWLIRWKYYV